MLWANKIKLYAVTVTRKFGNVYRVALVSVLNVAGGKMIVTKMYAILKQKKARNVIRELTYQEKNICTKGAATCMTREKE